MHFRLVFRWLVVLVACLLVQTAHAAAVDAIQIGTANRYGLSTSFTYLEDSSAQLGLQDILQPQLQAQFAPASRGGKSTNFGSTNAAIWLRVQLQLLPNAPAQWLLEVSNPPLDRMDLYVSTASGEFTHQFGGDSLPFTDRVIPHRNHVYALNLSPGATHTLYLKIASQGTVSAPTVLWQPQSL